MTFSNRSSVRVAVATAALALSAAGARAQVPGPDRVQVLRTADGPRVLLAGVGVGTPMAEASRRLGGPGAVAAFFGAGPIVKQGELDGARCHLMAFDEEGRVRDLSIICEGGRAVLERLAERFRAALAAAGPHEDASGAYYGDAHLVATVSVGPASEDGWWARWFGPRELRVGIRR